MIQAAEWGFRPRFLTEPSAKLRNSFSGTEHSVKPQFKQIKSCGNTITCGLRRASSPPGKWIQISVGKKVWLSDWQDLQSIASSNLPQTD